MRSGRHFAQFTVLEGPFLFFGVIRPGWDVEAQGTSPWRGTGERGADAYDEDGHCLYAAYQGHGFPGNHRSDDGYEWEGKQNAREPGDRIGMLLDLDQGSMTVYKNDVLMGVMVAEGLTGPLCWALEAFAAGNSARIESAPAPTSPTEELALAKEYRAKGLAEAETGAA